jgi:hypothetical protein
VAKKKESKTETAPTVQQILETVDAQREAWRDAIPYNVWRVFGNKNAMSVEICGLQLTDDGDYIENLAHAREVAEWLVAQFGGKVEWKS